jgi:hypothetical protein
MITAIDTIDEFDDFEDEDVVALREAVADLMARGGADHEVPADWYQNSDVAFAMLELAALIAVTEETAMPSLGGGKDLFLQWAERAYVKAKSKRL